MALTVISCVLGAFGAAKFANRCEIRKLNKVVGVVLGILGIVTILIKIICNCSEPSRFVKKGR